MTNTSTPEIDKVKGDFLSITGLREIEIQITEAGPERFLTFQVGRKAPIYSHALKLINERLPDDHPFRGRLLVEPAKFKSLRDAPEVELLRSLIARSLQVTPSQLTENFRIRFAPFRGNEGIMVSQAANHVIKGRRGVGKSSLILLGVQRVRQDGNVPIWLDLEPLRGREDPGAVVTILRQVCERLSATAPEVTSLADVSVLLRELEVRDQLSETVVTSAIQRTNEALRSWHSRTRKKFFVFLDDAHYLGTRIQPFTFSVVHAALKATSGYLKIAGVEALLRLYDGERRTGLQVPNDVQVINLDLNLVNPGAAKEHLESIFKEFILACGFGRTATLLPTRAFERLVWCSAGVPRDFLWLFERGLGHAIEFNRAAVGVQDINVATGEYSQLKLDQVNQDSPEDAGRIRNVLNIIQNKCLNEARINAFLIRHLVSSPVYVDVKKIADLRLIHVLNPSITPDRAGENYEAYLLDYSFYTGVRRRQGIRELKITAATPPRYSELRKLPRIELKDLDRVAEVAA